MHCEQAAPLVVQAGDLLVDIVQCVLHDVGSDGRVPGEHTVQGGGGDAGVRQGAEFQQEGDV